MSPKTGTYISVLSSLRHEREDCGMTGRGAGSVSDSSEEAQQKLAALEAKYADDLTRSEGQFVEVAESMSGRVWFTPPPHHDSATRKGSAHQGETHSRTFASGGVGKRVNRDGPRGRCHRSDVKPGIRPEIWLF